MKILIAEDNPANRELLRAILEVRGCEVEEAADGHEALLKVQEIVPDAVLMDVQMPRLNGVETLERLRAEPMFAEMPVIALTAYAMRGDRERFLAAGFDGYVSKPIEGKAVWKELEQLLSQPKRPAQPESE